MVEFWTFDMVQERLVEAMEVLLRGADRERAWLETATMSLWRQAARDDTETAEDDKPIVTCRHTRLQVAMAEEALAWVDKAVATGPTRHVLGLGLVQLARGDRQRIEWTRVWRAMGGQAGGWTTDGLRMRYSRAITAIAVQLNRTKS
ncbi:hypothetical protein SAMN05444678_102252 [Sphingomonas sp. YR710]|uniref:hypothetical protein n=1 Tax=Sphingomonas sp. YR710 TaxID=1882773 RepID=UPI0008876652|nr:hypothetical protein [Sphingomonas sp. YR710]SDC30518.1 hypothetical protein SAMN05444678_102252 [Sphingomonas sp. YR710]